MTPDQMHERLAVVMAALLAIGLILAAVYVVTAA